MQEKQSSKLTEKQQKIYTFMQKFKKKHGYPPGAVVIGKACGMSTESVQQKLKLMVKNGYLVRGKTVNVGVFHPVEK